LLGGERGQPEEFGRPNEVGVRDQCGSSTQYIEKKERKGRGKSKKG